MKAEPASRPSQRALSGVATSGSWWRRPWVAGLALLVLVLAAYQSVWHAGFIWDDDVYVTKNSLLTAPDGWWRIWFSAHTHSQYFPLVFTTFRLEHALWGFDPLGYHLVNILLHGANACLVWMVLCRLKVPGAWLAAAIFALHPVQVESVAWVTELKNTESTCLYLLAVLAWMRFVEGRIARPWLWYLLALGLHALALSAKTTACTLPVALLLVLWLKKERIDGKRILQVLPFVVLGLGMGALSVWWERHLGNYTVESGVGYSLGARVLIASRAIWFYAGKFLWPVDLTFSYPKWKIDIHEAGQYAWLAAGVAVAGLAWWKRKVVGRGLSGPIFFVATLSPLVGFIWLYTFRYSFVADHYQYLACLGLITPAAALVTSMSRKWDPWVMPGLSVALLLVLGILTWRQGATYLNEETLWRTTLERNPDSWLACDNLGTVLMDERQDETARHLFERALAINPVDDLAFNNLGVVSFKAGQVDAAILYYQKALAIQPRHPVAENNLANALRRAGRMDEALAHLRNVLAIDPNSAVAHNYLGNVYFQTGQLEAARNEYRLALLNQPDYIEALNNLGACCLSSGDVAEAIVQWQKVLSLNPRYLQAYQNLAWVLATHPRESVRNGAQALMLAREGDRLSDGKDPMMLQALAAAYAENGKFAEAIQTAQRALPLASASLAGELQDQIKVYQSNRPFRDPGFTEGHGK